MAGLLCANPAASSAGLRLCLASRPNQTARTRRTERVAVKAQQQPRQPGPQPGLNTVLQRLAKYDFVSTGLGAAAVTSVCVAQGQDPWFALWLTFCATVTALVFNELLPQDL